MEITIQGTKVNIIGDRIIGFQLNNLVNRFEATTDKDETWDYTLAVYMFTSKKYNVINLNRHEQTLYVDLTSDMLSANGRYEMQFVANRWDTGEVFRTEKFQVWVEDSIDPSRQYDEIPSEFYQIEENIQKMYKEVKDMYEDISQSVLDINLIDGGNAQTEY